MNFPDTLFAASGNVCVKIAGVNAEVKLSIYKSSTDQNCLRFYLGLDVILLLEGDEGSCSLSQLFPVFPFYGNGESWCMILFSTACGML